MSSSDTTKFKVIGSYCINVLYHNLYKRSQVDKVEYPDYISRFINAIRADSKLLRKFVQDGYKFYRACSRKESLSYDEFISDMCHEITTKEMRKKIKTFEQEHELVTTSIYELLSGLGTYLTKSDNIKYVTVDENRQGDAAKTFTDGVLKHAVDILTAYKTRIINTFIEKNTGVKTVAKTDGIRIEVYEKIIRALNAQNKELKEKLRKYRRRVDDLEAELEDLENGEGDEGDEGDDNAKDEQQDAHRDSRRDDSHRRTQRKMHSQSSSGDSFFNTDVESKNKPSNRPTSEKSAPKEATSPTDGANRSERMVPFHESALRIGSQLTESNSKQPNFKLPGRDPADVRPEVSHSGGQESMVEQQNTTSDKPSTGVGTSTDSLARLEQLVEDFPSS
jgi:hypothetical protein